MTNRNIAFDVLKGTAIIAVVLYHFGLCPNGYLGVDLFLVIAGFFTAKSLWKQTDKRIMGRGKYLLNRVLRLLPLLLIAEVLILGYGFLFMMPDNFENNSQSIIATNFFSNNILANITTKNYWDAVNEFKPLMHTWYLGILMEFYILFVIIDLVIYKLTGKNRNIYLNVWIILTIISLMLYFIDFPYSSKFYLLPFRIFEFGTGCIIFYLSDKHLNKIANYIGEWIVCLTFIGLFCMFFFNITCFSQTFKLLIVVLLSGILLYFTPQSKLLSHNNRINKLLALLGASSFSIYVWHQIIFALTRYSFTSDLFYIPVSVVIFFIIGILSILSYKYIERMRFTNRKIIAIILMFFAINASAFIVYKRAGIFYNIPELEVTTNNIKSGIWAEYCDNGYRYDRDFTNSGKAKWMVVGNSFGRDFVNIIQESGIGESIDLSYSDNYSDSIHVKRINQADIVFISSLGVTENMITTIKEYMKPSSKLVVVGEKNFGVSNGQVFRRRNNPDYFESAVEMENGYAERNEELKKLYSPNFIDLIEIVRQPDGKVRVFSEDNRFISQDCRHLTKAGAQFYASKICWDEYLNINN